MRGTGARRVVLSFELEGRRLHDQHRVLDQATYGRGRKERGREEAKEQGFRMDGIGTMKFMWNGKEKLHRDEYYYYYHQHRNQKNVPKKGM